MATAKRVLDFTNVKDGGQFNKKRQPEGDYEAKVLSCKEVPKKKKPGETQWLFTIKVGSGTYPYYCGFGADELWKVRNLLIAAGKVVQKKKIKLSGDVAVGAKIAVTLEDDEYDGKKQSNIASVFPLADLEEKDEDVDADDEDEADDEDDDTEEASDDDEDEDLEELDIEDV